MSCRRQKRKECTLFVDTFFDVEFKRRSDLGAKITSMLLMDVAKHALSICGCPVCPDDVGVSSGKPCSDLINNDYITRYRQLSDIVRRRKCGNLSRSPEFEEWSHRCVAYYLGVVSRAFQSGRIYEDWVYNLDETHLLYGM